MAAGPLGFIDTNDPDGTRDFLIVALIGLAGIRLALGIASTVLNDPGRGPDE